MLIDGGAPASADGWAVAGKEQLAIAENMPMLLAGLRTWLNLKSAPEDPLFFCFCAAFEAFFLKFLYAVENNLGFYVYDST